MRFVIHHHTGVHPGADHMDFMVEMENGLASWRIAVNDMNKLLGGEPATAQKIADHGKEYLSYEGPVSRDRGRVTIVDSGDCELVLSHSDAMECVFSGKKLIGRLTITRVSGDLFSFRYGVHS